MKSVYRILIFLLCILSSLTVYAEDIFMGEIRDIPTLPDSYPEAPDGFLPVCHRRSTSDLVVAITIDDCNQPGNLSEMIRIISGVGGHATIFPIGENVSMLTGILRNAVDAGYELGNHTMTHSGLYWEDDEGLAYQIWQQDHEVDEALGYDYRMRFMRPRGGDNRYDQRTHAYLRQLGYSGIAYWSQVGSGNTAANLMANMHTGDIILFHTTNHDLQVIRELVPMLYRKGYRLVTLSELFYLPENQRFDLRHGQAVGGNPVDQFLLQRREEALHPGVVVAVGHAAQALRQALPGKLRAERFAGVLAPAVAVQNGVPDGKSAGHGPDGVNAQLLFHVVPHLQREDLAAEAVHDRGDVQLTVPALHLGNIRQQLREGLIRVEILLQQVL